MTRSNRLLLAASWVLLALLAGSLVVGGVARAGSSASPAAATEGALTITTQGHGETTVAPDRAYVMLGVQTRGPEAQGTLSSNSDKMQTVLNDLKSKGIAEKRIQTADLNIWYDTEHSVYVVTHNVNVQLDDVTAAGRVLDAAVASGVNSSWGVTFGLKDASQPRSSALKAAMKDARKRADTIAGSMGVHITGIKTVSEGSSAMSVKGLGAGGGGGTPIQAGQIAVPADVTVTYTFQ